jgi:macrolide-specific efflux system membrane fusion protein
VVSLTAREGQTLVSSQQAPIILRIADLGTMTVSTQVSEADVPKVALNMPVYFNTLGQPDRRWEGTVRQILPTPEVINNVVLYNVLFDVANTDGALRPQMSAQSYFVIARAEDAVTVPMAALQAAPRLPRAEKAKSAMDAVAATPEAPAEKAAPRKGGRRSAEAGSAPRPRAQLVRVVRADGTIEERRVMVGVTNRVQAQVLSGLEPGETVVIGMQDGAATSAAPAKKGAQRPAAKARL